MSPRVCVCVCRCTCVAHGVYIYFIYLFFFFYNGSHCLSSGVCAAAHQRQGVRDRRCGAAPLQTLDVVTLSVPNVQYTTGHAGALRVAVCEWRPCSGSGSHCSLALASGHLVTTFLRHSRLTKVWPRQATGDPPPHPPARPGRRPLVHNSHSVYTDRRAPLIKCDTFKLQNIVEFNRFYVIDFCI